MNWQPMAYVVIGIVVANVSLVWLRKETDVDDFAQELMAVMFGVMWPAPMAFAALFLVTFPARWMLRRARGADK